MKRRPIHHASAVIHHAAAHPWVHHAGHVIVGAVMVATPVRAAVLAAVPTYNGDPCPYPLCNTTDQAVGVRVTTGQAAGYCLTTDAGRAAQLVATGQAVYDPTCVVAP